MWCDHEAIVKFAHSDCPVLPEPDQVSVPDGVWQALMHPGLSTWTQRVAVGCWLALVLAGLSVARHLRRPAKTPAKTQGGETGE